MKYLKDVVTLELNSEKCIGCGMCMTVCPHGVFQKQESKVKIADKDACMECGACKRNCPVQAINVREGVGCAYGIIMGKLLGTEPTCGCSCEDDSSSSKPSCC